MHNIQRNISLNTYSKVVMEWLCQKAAKLLLWKLYKTNVPQGIIFLFVQLMHIFASGDDSGGKQQATFSFYK